MGLEFALVQELATGELADKVFPLNAPPDTKAPYVIYLSSEGIHDRTLLGFLESREVTCELNVLHSSYNGLKQLTAAVLATVRSMPGRNIATGGPLIQDLTYDDPVELYEQAVKLYRCNIQLTIRL